MHQIFENKTTELEKLQGKIAILEHKTNMLHTDNLDIDILDEYTRKTLAIAKQNELVIPQNNLKKQY